MQDLKIKNIRRTHDFTWKHLQEKTMTKYCLYLNLLTNFIGTNPLKTPIPTTEHQPNKRHQSLLKRGTSLLISSIRRLQPPKEQYDNLFATSS